MPQAGPTPVPEHWPTWVTVAPVHPSNWTTVEQAEDALKRCYFDLENDGKPNIYGVVVTYDPFEVETVLDDAVFISGFPHRYTLPKGLPPGAGDIWAWGNRQGCWEGVPGGHAYRQAATWTPKWAD